MSFSCLADGVPAPWESNREAGTPRAAASFCQISYRNIIKHDQNDLRMSTLTSYDTLSKEHDRKVKN